MELRHKIVFWIFPIFVWCFLLTLSEAYLQSVRIEEIPFALTQPKNPETIKQKKHQSSGIHLISSLEHQRAFFNIFRVPYIICFYAAKGKWPYMPGFMKSRVDNAARNFFKQNDSIIKQACTKWIQVKECFRPLFDKPTETDSETETLNAKYRQCNCDKLGATAAPLVYFDKNHIGNVSSGTILSTIEFLESFLPPTTKKNKRKNRVRGRIDEMEID
ncbi:uncharacterized protein LOC115634576 [Scaptodrosophila lebanonensis]|uniref:Uncharacterized protein LOC115634576 n=1 Tax=Drosophila lebanonensis TaxID=7225 RepID=A0A6J2UM09_DROLE|nr:uncharacterized protein LOC115634576 [Scaptodrosophila lebanonensis]